MLSEYRFTNAYRAADRVSQYLIHRVIYDGDQDPREVVFRTLLFKLFNRVSTWERLEDSIGDLRAADFEILYGEGTSREGELIEMGVNHNIVEKSGAWYSYAGDRIGQGKDNTRLFLKENADVAKEIEDKLRAKLIAAKQAAATGNVGEAELEEA